MGGHDQQEYGTWTYECEGEINRNIEEGYGNMENGDMACIVGLQI